MADHFGEAASALHAVGDKRNLALVHSLSGSALAQQGRYDEALMALRQAERARQRRSAPTTSSPSSAATRPTSR